MAEKTLHTRIINKHAELETWKSSELLLKEGEIALAKVMVAQPDGTTAPTYVAKIGLDGKKFADSPMLFAPASDVHEWAKAATKPTYNATEIALTTGDKKSVEQEIIDLKAAVGDTDAVTELINAAIATLDVDDWAEEDGIKFVTAVKEENGKISVTRRELSADDIPALGIDNITGLQDAINAAKKAGTDAQTYAEGIYKVDGETKTGVLADYITNNDERVKTIEDNYIDSTEAGSIAESKITTLVNNGQVKANTEAIAANSKAIADLAGEGNTSTVKANADAIAKLAQDIGNVANVMNFRGVSVKGEGTVPGHDITEPQNGDVIIYGDAEYVYNVVGETGSWVKFGDASDNATAIATLQERVGTVETRLNSGDIHNAIVAAKEQADKGVADAKTANDAIAIINGSGDGSIAKSLSDAKKYTDDKVADAKSSIISSIDGKLATKQDIITEEVSSEVVKQQHDFTQASWEEYSIISPNFTTESQGGSMEYYDYESRLFEYEGIYTDAPAIDELVFPIRGSVYKINEETGDYEDEDFEITSAEDIVESYDKKYYYLNKYILVVVDDEALVNHYGEDYHKSGIYATTVPEVGQARIDQMAYTTGGTSTVIKEQYIPNTIARTSDVTEAINAEVSRADGKYEKKGTAQGLINSLNLPNTYQAKGDYATAAQGAKADTAIQTISTPADADGEPNGLKAVKTGTDVAITIDETVTWVFDCGGAENN